MRRLPWALLIAAWAAAARAGDAAPPPNSPADATTALQALIDRGGAVRIPAGRHRLSRTLRVELARCGPIAIDGGGVAELVMAAAGPAIHVVGEHRGSADPASVAAAVWLRQRAPLVADLQISGEHPQAVGLRLEGAMQPIVTRLFVRRVRDGVVLTGVNRNVIVSDCQLYDNLGAGLLLESLNLHQVNVANCHISYNRAGGIVVRQSEIRNLQIANCDIEANMSAEEVGSANVLLDVSTGSVREGTIVGCTLQHTMKVAGGANIRFLGAGPAAPHKVGFFSIGDNLISDAETNIHLRHARGVTIAGNNFFGGGKHHLLVEGSSQIVVGANLFDRNPDYPKGGLDGLRFDDCRDLALAGFQLVGGQQAPAAVVLCKCRRANIGALSLLDCAAGGLLLEECAQVRVSGCLVDSGGRGGFVPLRVVGGEQNHVGDNTFGENAARNGRRAQLGKEQ